MSEGEDNHKMSEEMTLTMSNMRPQKIEMVETEKEGVRRMKFELMDNKQLYNGLRFTGEALKHQYEKFQEGDFDVYHGVDHTGAVLETLGQVVSLSLVEEGEDVTVFAEVEDYMETEAQKQAAILFKQGMLNYVSGGWRASIGYNEETKEFEIHKAILREISSTNIPAKTDAKKLEAVCASLFNELALPEKISQEEMEMSDEKPIEKPVEQSAEFTDLQAKYDALQSQMSAMQKDQAEMKRQTLLKAAEELGLPATDFEGMDNAQIEKSLEVANKVVMSNLRAENPDIGLGGEGGNASFEDGSPELVEYLANNYYDFEFKGGE